MQTPPDVIFSFTSKKMLVDFGKFVLYHNLRSYFSKIHFNDILYSISRSSNRYFLLISYLFHQCPTHIIRFALIIILSERKEDKIPEPATYHLLDYLALMTMLIILWQWGWMVLNEVTDFVEYRPSQASKFLHKLQFFSLPPTPTHIVDIAGSTRSRFDFHKLRDDLPRPVMLQWLSGTQSRNSPGTKRSYA
jgi:hypothetical protein